MHPTCSVCGLKYERGPGYFTGAMYASYTIGVLVTLPVWIAMLAAGAALVPTLAVAFAIVLLMTPISFHYSRVFWMHVDCYFNPESFRADL
jgi:hypothetical protein